MLFAATVLKKAVAANKDSLKKNIINVVFILFDYKL